MFLKTLLVCCMLAWRPNEAAPRGTERMTMTKMRATDLESSATGYVYNQQQGLPVYYVQYTNHGSGRYYHAPDTLRYVAPVAHALPETAPLLVNYAVPQNVADKRVNEETAGHGEMAAAAVDSKPLAPYFVPQTVDEKEDKGKGGYDVVEESEDSEEHDEDDDEDEDEDHDEDDGNHGGSSYPVTEFNGGYGSKGSGESHGGGGSSFEAGGGEKHSSEEHSEQREKGQNGYKNSEEFSKGEHGSDDNAHKEGYYNEKGGQKNGHVDDAEEHGSHEESEKGVKGSDYGNSSHHKKGRKTNGFHNIYHKDEYKKETDFYDDDHKKGHFEKYDEFDKGYKSEESGFKKGGHHSSGHDQEDHGKKGHYDKGHHDSLDQGHDSEKGQKSYYSNHEDYGAEKGSKFAKSHKFGKGDAGYH